MGRLRPGAPGPPLALGRAARRRLRQAAGVEATPTIHWMHGNATGGNAKRHIERSGAPLSLAALTRGGSAGSSSRTSRPGAPGTPTIPSPFSQCSDWQEGRPEAAPARCGRASRDAPSPHSHSDGSMGSNARGGGPCPPPHPRLPRHGGFPRGTSLCQPRGRQPAASGRAVGSTPPSSLRHVGDPGSSGTRGVGLPAPPPDASTTQFPPPDSPTPRLLDSSTQRACTTSPPLTVRSTLTCARSPGSTAKRSVSNTVTSPSIPGASVPLLPSSNEA